MPSIRNLQLLEHKNRVYRSWEGDIIKQSHLERSNRQRQDPLAMSQAAPLLEEAVRRLLGEVLPYPVTSKRVLRYDRRRQDGSWYRKFQEMDVVALRDLPGPEVRRVWRVFEVKSGYHPRRLRGRQIRRIRRLVKVMPYQPALQKVWVDCMEDREYLSKTPLEFVTLEDLEENPQGILYLRGADVWRKVLELGLTTDEGLWDRVVAERDQENRPPQGDQKEKRPRTSPQRMTTSLGDLAQWGKDRD